MQVGGSGEGIPVDPGGGPRSRVKHFTGCEVPSGAVRVHDHITGDDASYVAWVKLVVPKDRIDALVTSCGLEREALVQGYPTLAAPEERLPWWNPPEPDAMPRLRRSWLRSPKRRR